MLYLLTLTPGCPNRSEPTLPPRPQRTTLGAPSQSARDPQSTEETAIGPSLVDASGIYDQLAGVGRLSSQWPSDGSTVQLPAPVTSMPCLSTAGSNPHGSIPDDESAIYDSLQGLQGHAQDPVPAATMDDSTQSNNRNDAKAAHLARYGSGKRKSTTKPVDYVTAVVDADLLLRNLSLAGQAGSPIGSPQSRRRTSHSSVQSATPGSPVFSKDPIFNLLAHCATDVDDATSVAGVGAVSPSEAGGSSASRAGTCDKPSSNSLLGEASSC